MLQSIKKFLLTHEPFRPAHMGNWIREKYFVQYVPRYIPRTSKNILDGGCGVGHYARVVAHMFPHANIRAVDIKSFPEWLRDVPQNVTFEAADLLHLTEENARDFIYSIDVLEHIRGNDNVLRNFYRALQPDGYLYLAIPCELAERYILPKKFFATFYKWADDEHVGEMRPLKELRTLLEGVGFQILCARQTFTFFGHLAWELETLFHQSQWGRRANIILMPIFKLCGILDIMCPIGTGNNLIIAKRP
jgi:2-polyprenyl-3-methyl-5-hydroxy-6-metoxy-1,4-benzoquinol methylase